jgi:hypothetical protein
MGKGILPRDTLAASGCNPAVGIAFVATLGYLLAHAFVHLAQVEPANGST